MGCLDANLLQAWQDGRLEDSDRRETEGHLDTCADCRHLVATLVTGSTSARQAPAEQPLTLEATLPAAASPDAFVRPSSRIGRFVVTRQLGVGGMGVVYAAEDPELARHVAVKLLRGAVARDSALAARRIMREARLAARVSHPNVVSIYEVGQHQERVFIAMELVSGSSLTSWLKERPRSPREILGVFVDAGRGLAAAHAAGVVHRDFKPDNVLVGTDGRARVTDFGLARRGADEGGTTSPADQETARARRTSLTDLSNAAAILGTPAYMAPEQHSGANTDPRTDQFSFCVALYEALHGQRPFDGKTWEELSESVLAGRVKPPPPGSRVPSSLHRIVVRGLSVRPGDRYASMNELLGALGRDRGRPLRAWAYASLVALVAMGTALAGDWLARERTLAVTRSSFSAARQQLGRSLKLRYETFAAMSDLSYVIPVMRQVTGNVDDADFGLGAAEDDRNQLAELHANFQSADWLPWTKASQRGFIGVADYKGRLLYTGAAPDLWGNDVRVLSAVDSAYAGGSGSGHAMVIRGDDPLMVRSGLLGRQARPGLFVVFARATVVDDVPRAVFVQIIDGEKLLDDVSLGEGAQLALVAPGGASAGGAIPPRVLAAGRDATGAADEVIEGGRSWLVQSYPLSGLGVRQQEIARIVLARPIDAGLAGLFPRARLVLGLLTILLLFSTVLAAFLARSARLRLAAPRL